MKPPKTDYKVELSKREADIIQDALRGLVRNNNFPEEERLELKKLHARFVMGEWKK